MNAHEIHTSSSRSAEADDRIPKIELPVFDYYLSRILVYRNLVM